jgi:PqqD family protein of HPr-rel-A system
MSSSEADTVPTGATVVADPDHVSTAVDDEVVVLHLPTGTYHGLNGVGAHLWARLAEPRRVADLVASVADACDVDPAVCESDVRAFVADLAALGLVTVADADDPERRP